jgi:hypothetical protein
MQYLISPISGMAAVTLNPNNAIFTPAGVCSQDGDGEIEAP